MRAVGYWKRKLAISIEINSSDEQDSSNYQLDTRLGNAHLPNESRDGGPSDHAREA